MRKPPPLKTHVAMRMRAAEAAALDAACAIKNENRSVFVRRVVFDVVRKIVEGEAFPTPQQVSDNAVIDRVQESLATGAE